jgi:hypothetical protein
VSAIIWSIIAGVGVADVIVFRDCWRTHKRVMAEDAAKVKDTPHTIITDRNQFPEYVRQHECLKGIAVGACIKGLYIDPVKELAHAHMHGKHKGWVCMLSELQGHKLALLHEVAHLLHSSFFELFHVPHGKEWRKYVVSIGGSYKAFRINRIWTRDFTHIETQDDEDRMDGIVKEPSILDDTRKFIEMLWQKRRA